MLMVKIQTSTASKAAPENVLADVLMASETAKIHEKKSVGSVAWCM
jgi:hypothetical protein